jgi:hypothetical protein
MATNDDHRLSLLGRLAWDALIVAMLASSAVGVARH